MDKKTPPTQKESQDSLAEGLLGPGVIIRGFRIVRVLRAGQSNNVYVAVGPTGQEVAIKEYYPRKYAKRLPSGRIAVSAEKYKNAFESGVKGFVTEAIALAEIRNELLAKYVAAFRDNGSAYLITVMEPGDTLEGYARQIIRSRKEGQPFPREQDLRLIFWSLLNAVQVMHDVGFLHLDIKPSNVIMQDDFVPVLIDLGGARRFPFDPINSKVSASTYTPGFAAPEQHQERSADLCPETDVYGIGSSILYCMTGRIPPLGGDRLVKDNLEEMLAKCKPHYSEQMIDIVRHCMKIEISERGSVRQVQELIASH